MQKSWSTFSKRSARKERPSQRSMDSSKVRVGNDMVCEGGNSRVSIPQLWQTISNFSAYKRDLVREIGFEGLLDLPKWDDVDRKFSLWLMSKVDPATSALVLDDRNKIPFCADDIHKVFCIPCGQRDVHGEDAEISAEGIKFLQEAIGLTGKDSHSLMALEVCLKKEVKKNSSRMEHDCFNIAFVVDYWGALKNANDICRYNWGKYVVDHLLQCCEKVRMDIQGKVPKGVHSRVPCFSTGFAVRQCGAERVQLAPF